jgi:uncharacterized protein (TIGR02588 family)
MSKEQPKLDAAPAWMWAIGLLGLLLVAGSIGFALYEAVAGDASPPDVTVKLEGILPVQDGYLVEFRAVNEGGTTAAGLTVEGELRDGAEVVEVSDATIDYVPSHSEREGGLFFTQDPRQYDLQLRAKGFESP